MPLNSGLLKLEYYTDCPIKGVNKEFYMRYRGLSDFQEWDQFFDSFFNLPNSLAEIARESLFEPIKKLPSAIVSNPQTLPSNIYVNEDKSYNIDIAVAGIPKERITVDSKDDYVVISFEGESTNLAGKGDAESIETAVTKMESTNVVISNGRRYIQRNIKEPKGKQSISYFIDPNYYDKDTLKAHLEEGILHITVNPLKEREVLSSTKKILIS